MKKPPRTSSGHRIYGDIEALLRAHDGRAFIDAVLKRSESPGRHLLAVLVPDLNGLRADLAEVPTPVDLLQRATAESIAVGQGWVAAEHLLLALIASAEASDAFSRQNVTVDAARRALTILSGQAVYRVDASTWRVAWTHLARFVRRGRWN